MIRVLIGIMEVRSNLRAGWRGAILVFLTLGLMGCGQSGQPAADGLLVVTDTIQPDTTLEGVVMILEPDSIDEILGLGTPRFGDLDSMVKRRYIRVLVPYTPTFYHIDGKDRKGLALDMGNILERELNRKLGFRPPKVGLIYIPCSRTHMIELLNGGYGDLAMAGLSITPEREFEVDFSRPTMNGIRQVIVGGPNSPKINSLADLSGKKVYVHKGSSYYSNLTELNASLAKMGAAPVLIAEAEPFLDDEDLLVMVSSGSIPFTAIAEEMANHWQAAQGNLKIYSDIPLDTNMQTGWAFRKNSPQLKKVIDEVIYKFRIGTLTGNMIYNKHLKGKGELGNVTTDEAMERLRQTKAIFQKYADQYELDWLFMVAQGYQESGLNHNRKSHAGAVGIMQVKPSTAAGSPIYIKDVYNIENNIHASAKYMDYIYTHYLEKDSIDPLNKQLLALASYNAGPNRIAKLRRIAEAQGLDPDLWFDNVEIVAARSIGRETPTYVGNIYKYYCSYRTIQHYQDLTKDSIIP